MEGDDVLGNALAFSPSAWAEGRYWTLLTYAWAHARLDVRRPGPFLAPHRGQHDFFKLPRTVGGAFFGTMALPGSSILAARWRRRWLGSLSTRTRPTRASSGRAAPCSRSSPPQAQPRPRARVVAYLLFVLPVRMSLGFLAIAACAIEAAQMIFGWFPGVAHAAHLGGALFGCLYVLGFRWITRARERVALLR